ncbi:response regulator [Skermanella pratensis]|uniref:response regulator n=1 Tax=Skermanella pratensis TaxID=2233999 RepID=UPI0013014748|nr:response regulator [Skermanella pratensis]
MTQKTPTASAAGQRVLVVEDEMFIAMGISLHLKDAGYLVIGPAGRLDKAMDLARSEMVDAALLDVNLRSDTVYPVADILTARDIPFTFLTGYNRESLPDRFGDGHILKKPFQTKELIRIVGTMLVKKRAPADRETASGGANGQGTSR